MTASDLTPELLDAGRRARPRPGWSSSGSRPTPSACPFDDESFDVVMSCIGVMFAPHHQAAADELVRVCRPGGTLALLSWTPEGMLGALFRTMGPFAPPPPPGRPAAAAVGQRGAPRTSCSATASSFTRSSATCSRSPPSNTRATTASTSSRTTGRRSPCRRTRAGRSRGGVRRRARPVLRRVEPRRRRSRPLREGVPARRRTPPVSYLGPATGGFAQRMRRESSILESPRAERRSAGANRSAAPS